MASILRLLVGAGLFAFGYYLGRESCKQETDDTENDLEEPPMARDSHEGYEPLNIDELGSVLFRINRTWHGSRSPTRRAR